MPNRCTGHSGELSGATRRADSWAGLYHWAIGRRRSSVNRPPAKRAADWRLIWLHRRSHHRGRISASHRCHVVGRGWGSCRRWGTYQLYRPQGSRNRAPGRGPRRAARPEPGMLIAGLHTLRAAGGHAHCCAAHAPCCRGICSLLGLADGHMPTMSSPGPGDWACPPGEPGTSGCPSESRARSGAGR